MNKGKTLKQPKPEGRMIAPTLLEFWRRLAANSLDLTPPAKK